MPGAAFCAEKHKKMSTKEYIELYKSLAIDAMYEYGIPASIKLAQAIIESDNGNSPLALKANNHIGIKCKTSWTGDKMLYDDDAKDECFRSYQSAYDSYRDHSDFLSNSPRYSFLFDLAPTDYKAWARGLSHAGYATNPDYSNMLIRTIEQNALYKIDREIMANDAPIGTKRNAQNESGSQSVTPQPATPAGMTPQVPENTTPYTQPTQEPPLSSTANRVESRPGSGQKSAPSGPIIIPSPKVIGTTRAPQRSGRNPSKNAEFKPTNSNVQQAPVVTPPQPVIDNNPIIDNGDDEEYDTELMENYDMYEYAPEDFEPAKPVEDPDDTELSTDDTARPGMTYANVAYGAPGGAPIGYYDGPKFDPAGMPAYGSKGDIMLYHNNNVPCIIVAPGQTLESISTELRTKPSILLAYNELKLEPMGLAPGSIFYIAPKASSVRNGYRTHYVVKGETLHYVAQKYGISMAKLAKANGVDIDYQIKPGQKLKLK